MHQETEHKWPSNSHSRALWRRTVALVASLFLSVMVGTPCSGGATMPATAKGQGRATIVYQDNAIQPENRDAIKKIRDSGVFERMVDRLTKTVALPHDLQVVVTDKLPKGFDDPTTECGRSKDLMAGGVCGG